MNGAMSKEPGTSRRFGTPNLNRFSERRLLEKVLINTNALHSDFARPGDRGALVTSEIEFTPQSSWPSLSECVLEEDHSELPGWPGILALEPKFRNPGDP